MFNLHQRNTPLRFKLINYSVFVLVSYNIRHIPRSSSTKTCKLFKQIRTGFTNVPNRHTSTKKVFPAWNCKTLLGKLYIFSRGVVRAWRCALWIIFVLCVLCCELILHRFGSAVITRMDGTWVLSTRMTHESDLHGMHQEGIRDIARILSISAKIIIFSILLPTSVLLWVLHISYYQAQFSKIRHQFLVIRHYFLLLATMSSFPIRHCFVVLHTFCYLQVSL